MPSNANVHFPLLSFSRHLDISNSDEKLGIFTEPNRTLTTLVESLPLLTSLDISGTNLAGKGVFDATKDCDDETLRACDIPGLVSRVSNPLEFLGLYKSWYEACCRRQIPALRVS